ncbi:unnamed protein product [Rotaria sordida]|uniref:Uncharacterized protein n=2 Tax=Rotaria sordida TaxID=392033 RepID=A0A815M5X2_9BILA|nr:unnamed protein product [Rotaria sordida]
MGVEFPPLSDIEQYIDEIFHSFRTYFWIKKHRWFVQCDWCPMDINTTGILYTLPYAFDTFYCTDGSRSKSTSLNDLDYSSYYQVQTLEHIHRKQNLGEVLPLFSFRFLNIRHLKVILPFNDNFWSVIPTLDRLISLDVTLNRDLGYPQLQTLLDRAPRLYSLSFCHLNNFSMASFNISSTSIRRLELFQKFSYGLRYFNSTECCILAGSSLVFQCEVLIIDVESRSSVLDFINIMPNVRVLVIRCNDDKSSRFHLLEANDELIEWFHDHLLSKFTYSIIRNPNYNSQIILWIHRGRSRHL